jgi:hypothetical protein
MAKKLQRESTTTQQEMQTIRTIRERLLADNQQLKSKLAELQQQQEKLQKELLTVQGKMIGTLQITVREARGLKQKKRYGMLLGLTGPKDYQQQYSRSESTLDYSQIMASQSSPSSSPQLQPPPSAAVERSPSSTLSSPEQQQQQDDYLDAFVTLKYQNQLYRTRTLRSTHPKWEQSFTFFVDSEKATVDVAVWHSHMIGNPGFRGKVTITTPTSSSSSSTTQWYPLQPKQNKERLQPSTSAPSMGSMGGGNTVTRSNSSGSSSTSKEMGEICLTVVYNREIVQQ